VDGLRRISEAEFHLFEIRDARSSRLADSQQLRPLVIVLLIVEPGVERELAVRHVLRRAEAIAAPGERLVDLKHPEAVDERQDRVIVLEIEGRELQIHLVIAVLGRLGCFT
jgi:hypothetical protein